MRVCWILLLAAASGCLPSRDNDLDPANAPAPFLAIVDRTGPAGCETNEAGGEWQPLTVATRATCLALDAGGTSDPQGTTIERLRFTFERVDDATSPEPIGTPLQEATIGGSLFPIPPALVSSLPIGVDTVFRVTVEDPGGARGRSTAHVTLVNSAPVVTAGPTLYLPAHGRPWEALDTGIPVTLSARADDAENDAITSWSWTDAAGNPIGTSSSNLDIVIDVSEVGVQRYFVTASDGSAVSAAAPVSVAVGDPALWSGEAEGADNFVSLSRVDPLRGYANFFTGATPSSVYGATAIRAVADGTRLVFIGNDLVLVRWPELDVLDSEIPATFAVGATAAVVDGERLWISSPAVPGVDGYTRELAAYDLPAANSIAYLFGPLTIPADAGFEDTYLATDGAGVLWVTGQFEQRVFAVSPSPAVLGSGMLPAGSGFRALASRPGSPDVWAIAGQALGADLPQPALVRLRLGVSGVEVLSIPLDVGDADGLAWIDENRFWTTLGERGMCLVDASILEIDGSLDAAIEISHPSVSAFSISIPDPSSEAAWFSSATGTQAAYVSARGVDVFDSFATPQTLDGGGGLWFTRFSYAFTGALADDAVATTLSSSVVTATPDGEGGLWTISFLPRTLRRLGSDGRPLDFITELDFGGGDVRTLPLSFIMTSDGAGRLYLAGVFDFQDPVISFVEVDARGRSSGSSPRTTARIVLDGITTFPSSNLFSVSPPVSGSTGYLWWIDPLAQDALLRTSLDGSTTVAAIAASTLDNGAVSPVSGDVCWGRRVDFDTIELYVVTSAGGPALATTLTASAGTFSDIDAMTVGYDPVTREETCWIAYTEVNVVDVFHVEEYDRTGALLRAYQEFDVQDARSISAANEPGVVWVLRSGGGNVHLDLIQWDALGNSIRFDLGETDSTRFFR